MNSSMSTATFKFALPAALLAGLVLLAACDTLSNAQNQPRLEMNTVQVQATLGDSAVVAEGDTIVFRGYDIEEEGKRLPTVWAEGRKGGRIRISDGTLVVSGGIELSYGVKRRGEIIEVSILRDYSESDVGLPTATPVYYSGWVTDLDAGPYEVVVRHGTNTSHSGKEWKTVLTEEVQVQQ